MKVFSKLNSSGMDTLEKPLFFFDGDTYSGTLPRYYEPQQFEWTKMLEQNYEKIYEEISIVLSNENFVFHKNINPPSLSNPDGWTNLYFYNFLWKNHSNCERFPFT